MKYTVHANNGVLKFPETQIHSLLNDNLLIYVRLWSGRDSEEKVIDEILRYLSAADADLEVTTPFDHIESLSSLANVVRVALLLANEALYIENKEKYSQGFEIAICYKNNKEISMGSIGRFSFSANKTNKEFLIYESGGGMDDLTLLPTALLGLEREPEVHCASVSTRDLNSLQVSSCFDQDTYWKSELTQFD